MAAGVAGAAIARVPPALGRRGYPRRTTDLPVAPRGPALRSRRRLHPLVAPYEVFPVGVNHNLVWQCANRRAAQPCRNREPHGVFPTVATKGLLFLCGISALSEHWTPTSTWAHRSRRACRHHSRGRRILRDRRRGCWIHDADDHSRTGPESIPDQRLEVASGIDRSQAEQGRTSDVGPRQSIRHGRPEPFERTERPADDQREDLPDTGTSGDRSQTPGQ